MKLDSVQCEQIKPHAGLSLGLWHLSRGGLGLLVCSGSGQTLVEWRSRGSGCLDGYGPGDAAVSVALSSRGVSEPSSGQNPCS